MKKAFVIMLVMLVAVSVAFAGDGRKGKRTWKKNCRVACHDGSKAVELSPVSKTMSQWKSAFGPSLAAKHKGIAEFDATSAQDLDDIFTYLFDHALDSSAPETCG